MADYTSPKPIDPIWYQPNAFLRIECRCGRREAYALREFASYHRLSDRLLLYELIARLRCETCKQRPAFAEVTRWPSGNRR
jgi:hypothetical protein